VTAERVAGRRKRHGEQLDKHLRSFGATSDTTTATTTTITTTTTTIITTTTTTTATTTTATTTITTTARTASSCLDFCQDLASACPRCGVLFLDDGVIVIVVVIVVVVAVVVYLRVIRVAFHCRIVVCT
jgi:hypothetical protein